MKVLKRFKRSEKGQGMVEYGLILALVSVVGISALSGIGGGIKDTFSKVAASSEMVGGPEAPVTPEEPVIPEEPVDKGNIPTVGVDPSGSIVVTDKGFDISNSPGPKELIKGDYTAGFFGEVPASDFYTESELSSEINNTKHGIQVRNDIPWLKFAVDGKIVFKSKVALRHSISMDGIKELGIFNGATDGKTVEKDGKKYKVRLLSGAYTNNEWDRLMVPLVTGTSNWGVSYTDEDIGTSNRTRYGKNQWTQGSELVFDTFHPMTRGGGVNGVSTSHGYKSNLGNVNQNNDTDFGWSPALEYFE